MGAHTRAKGSLEGRRLRRLAFCLRQKAPRKVLRTLLPFWPLRGQNQPAATASGPFGPLRLFTFLFRAREMALFWSSLAPFWRELGAYSRFFASEKASNLWRRYFTLFLLAFGQKRASVGNCRLAKASLGCLRHPSLSTLFAKNPRAATTSVFEVVLSGSIYRN